MKQTTVGNVKEGIKQGFPYIGRGTIYGNRFKIGEHGDRAEVIEKFKEYFLARLKSSSLFKKHVELLRGKRLLCHCAPLPCHGDVIAEYLNSTEGS